MASAALAAATAPADDVAADDIATVADAPADDILLMAPMTPEADDTNADADPEAQITKKIFKDFC